MIEEISITITPLKVLGLGDARLHRMKVTVKAKGQRFEEEFPVNEDDLTSRLDYYMDFAKDRLRNAIKDSVKK